MNETFITFIQSVSTAIVVGALAGAATWWQSRKNHKQIGTIEQKLDDNTELTQQAVNTFDNQVDMIRLLKENDAQRQSIEALRIEVDMHRDLAAFMRADPACAPCVAARQAFIDRRRTRAPVVVSPVEPPTVPEPNGTTP